MTSEGDIAKRKGVLAAVRSLFARRPLPSSDSGESRVRALQESVRLLTETQAIAGLGSFVLDIPAGRWTSSAVLDGILGVVGILPIETTIGRSVQAAASLVHPDWREVIRRHFMEDVMGSRGKFDLECQIVRQNDGETRWVHALGRLECDPGGHPITMIGSVQDITDRKESDERLRLESIGLVAGGIAHDLNNVLQPITTAVDMLKPAATGESLSLLDAIHGNAQRGAQMVRGVLMFARGLDGRRLHVQVRDLIREIESITTETFPGNIQVRTTTSRDLWVVAGNPTQLHQVLINLCINSRDAMPAGGQISITARNVTFELRDPAIGEAPPGRYVVIQVSDMGTGIPQSIIDKIFDPFFTTKDAGKGTGLGLSTALAIVKGHGGFVRVSSKPGAGAQFWVFLPALPEGFDARAQAPRADLPRGTGELILVVDDEAAVREITRQTLEAFGYRVLVASNGAYAVAQFAKRSADIAVVVTNLVMPVMDGPATIRALIKLNPAVRIIAVSGSNGTVGEALPANEDGAIPILRKPYSPEALLRALRQAIGREESLV